MLWVRYRERKWIEKNSGSFLKADSMLSEIGLSFALVPLNLGLHLQCRHRHETSECGVCPNLIISRKVRMGWRGRK